MGNLTRSPELRYTPNGVAICEFGIAVNRRFMSNGIRKEETTFVEINVWQRQAEICKNRLQKGSLVMIEGRLKTDQWEERETGRKRSRIVVVAEKVNFIALPPREDLEEYEEEENENGSDEKNRAQRPNYQDKQMNRQSQGKTGTEEIPPPPEPEYKEGASDDDDGAEKIPF